MSITKEKLAAANKIIKTMPIKGKQYATVAQRLNAFREICPGGRVDTSICEIDNEHVVIQAKVYDEADHMLASGTAEEEKTASRINTTSYVENCETSAVGRALANAGLGSEENIASAEELANALMNQKSMLTGKALFSLYCTEHGMNAAKISKDRGLDKVSKGMNHPYYKVVAEMMETANE